MQPITFEKLHVAEYGDASNKIMTLWGLIDEIAKVYPRMEVSKLANEYMVKVDANGNAVMVPHDPQKDKPLSLENVATKKMIMVNVDLNMWAPEYYVGFKAGKFYLDYGTVPPFDDMYDDTANIGPAMVRFERLKAFVARNS